MPDGWRRVALRDVAAVDIERVPVTVGGEYPSAGVLNGGKGLFTRGVLAAEKTNYPHLHRLRPGRLVMRKLTAFEGAIGIVPAALDGYYVSTEFPTFKLSSELLPEFMTLVCQQPSFWHEMWLRSTGTVQRRKRVNPEALLAIEIVLPPVSEQRRIVDLLRSVNLVAESAKAAARRTDTALRELRRDAFSQADSVELGSLLLDIEAGRSPVAMERPPVDHERGVLKVSAVRSWGFDPTESKAVASTLELAANTRVEAGDLLLTRANTSDLVGLSCIVEHDPRNLYLSDKTLRLIPSEGQNKRALCELLLSPQVRDQLTLAATGTSGSMKNVSQPKLRSLRVPQLSIEDQTRLEVVSVGLRDVVAAQRREATAATSLEARLLSELLSGAHEIPDTYDELLDSAAV